MLDLRAYRAGFAPVLAALVLMAFSLHGEPDPLQPAVDTIQFDAASAGEATRELVRIAPARAPGTDGATAAADWLAARFSEVAAGTVAEQSFEASVDGSDVTLRNIILTLRGAGERAILIVAGRSSHDEPGVASSAAATGVLVELAAELGVSGREHTLILGSIDGGAAEAEGVRELVEGLGDSADIDAAVVISQPGSAKLVKPHLVSSSGSADRPSLELIRTAEDALAARAQVDAGLDGPLGQIAHLAIPAAAGSQAALLAEGIDAIAISSAGEVPLAADESGEEQLAGDSVERFGATALSLVGSLDARTTSAPAPSTYVRIGSNTVPAWAISLLALSLLAPPALPVAMHLVRARRDGTAPRALGWAIEWGLVGLAPLLALFALALPGLIPDPALPYDPGRFGIGITEVFALVLLAGVGAAVWWSLGLRRAPAVPAATLGAAAGAVCVAACALAWLANPFLALALAPLAHVVVIHALGGRRPAALGVPAALIALVPIAAVVLHVAAAFEWGLATPWQLVVLVAGGGLGLFSAVALVVALAAAAALVQAAHRPPASRTAPSRRSPELGSSGGA